MIQNLHPRQSGIYTLHKCFYKWALVIDFTQLPDEDVDSVKSDAMYVGDDNIYKDDGTVVGL